MELRLKNSRSHHGKFGPKRTMMCSVAVEEYYFAAEFSQFLKTLKKPARPITPELELKAGK